MNNTIEYQRYPNANREYKSTLFVEYSCAVKPSVRQAGNRLSGPTGTDYASLLA